MDSTRPGAAILEDSIMSGAGLYRFASELYPICRSITGQGVRQSLRLIGRHIPLTIYEVPSGVRVYDWEVPLEWNIEHASLQSADDGSIVDFRRHNLHVVSYSEPVSRTLSLKELQPSLHSLPEHPNWIPYRTSYYARSWGFCLQHETRQAMRAGKYRIEIQSSLSPGTLTYAELSIPGRTRDEVVFFTHVCHPSLANDNTSGMAVATALAAWTAATARRYSYRFVFAPGTIGSLCWLKRNEHKLDRVRAGLVLGLLGDSSPLTYKMSRDGNTRTDALAKHVLSEIDKHSTVIPFSPYGYDERQLCSPGFNLPMGRLTRSVNGGYAEYHSSADDLQLIKPECLEQSLRACQLFVTVLEDDRRYINLNPKGEPRLGKRGLYGPIGGQSPAESQHAMLWLLNQSDGSHSLLDVVTKSGLPFKIVHEAAVALRDAGLLRSEDPVLSEASVSLAVVDKLRGTRSTRRGGENLPRGSKHKGVKQ